MKMGDRYSYTGCYDLVIIEQNFHKMRNNWTFLFVNMVYFIVASSTSMQCRIAGNNVSGFIVGLRLKNLSSVAFCVIQKHKWFIWSSSQHAFGSRSYLSPHSTSSIIIYHHLPKQPTTSKTQVTQWHWKNPILRAEIEDMNMYKKGKRLVYVSSGDTMACYVMSHSFLSVSASATAIISSPSSSVIVTLGEWMWVRIK